MKHVDLCAGTGAFTLALKTIGNVKTVFTNDFYEKAKDIYELNFKTKLDTRDINDINIEEIPDHDILTGGFPCQPFSIAGKRNGFDDDRSNVFWTITRILIAKKPKLVVLENVKNIMSIDGGETFKVILETLKNTCGYNVNYTLMDTCKHTGIPQHRERIYIVCSLGFEVDLNFEHKTLRPLKSFLETLEVPDKYYYTEKSSTWPLLKESVLKTDTVYQYRRVYVRENQSKMCPTLTANMGGGGHNVPIIKDHRGIRKLTPRECFNLQGFPQNYKLPPLADCHLYKLAGNAVTVHVALNVMQKCLENIQVF